MIGVAVVGMGWWGRHLVKVLGEPSSRLDVVLTVDPDESTGADVRDLDKALADERVEAVLLCTPHSQHAAQIAACADAGKHVFSEKPLALTGEDARRTVAACRQAGVVLGIGHERRFETAMTEIARMVRDGELGTLLHAEAAFSHDKFRSLPATSWRGTAQDAPAAGMTGMGVHLTDAFISMFGRVERVHAVTGRRVLPLESGDVVSVHLELTSGITATMSALSVTPFYARYVVFGSEAWVESREKQHPEAGTWSLLTTCRRDEDPVTRELPLMDAVHANLEAFVDAVEGKAPYPFSDEELVHNVEVLEAIVASAATRAPVTPGA